MAERISLSGRLQSEGFRRMALSSWTLVPCWVVSVACGMGLLIHYENRPGDKGHLQSRWPTESQLVRASDRDTLLVFAHPKCPCTRATLDELAWVMTRYQDRFQATVVFLQPEGESLAWSRSDIWETAVQIPGVDAVADIDGREAQNFGMQTSGHVMVFSPTGVALFEGGITPSRGHRGYSPGRQSLVDLATYHDLAEQRRHAPVYGCPLFFSKAKDRSP